MKIAILSLDASLYSTKRLLEAGESQGHQIQVINYLQCYINLNAPQPQIIYNGQRLERFEAIIPRIAPSKTFQGTAIVRQFEVMGIFSSNSSTAILRSRDKLQCLQILAREGLRIPVTGYADLTQDIDELIKIVGGAPLVIKLLKGSQGMGVVLAETHQTARSLIELFRQLDSEFLVQEFIPESAGEDIRCFVIENEVIAAIKRQGAKGDFRANLHQGGKAQKVKLTAEEKKIAVLAAKATGLNIAGVDLLRSKRGPLILEVNSSPGLEGIEKATQVNVAGRMIDFVTKNAMLGNISARF